MNSIAKRTYFAMALACVLLFGLATFLVRYVLYAGEWVTYPGSPHVYSTSGSLNIGTVTDRSGTVLLDTTDGRDYAKDAAVRKATVHLLGDREGNIPSVILNRYAEKLVGFDLLNGTYSLAQGQGACELTISAQVQSIALQALNGRKGTVGVYNYKTGEILCAVSSPTYDPDNVPDIANDTTGAYDGAYVNRFFNTSYTPGSIFKILTTAAAIETIPDIDEQTFTCNGTVIVGGETITCEGVHNSISFKDAFAHSCNCAYADISTQLGAKTLTKYTEQAGVMDSLTVDGLHTAEGNFDLSDDSANNVAWAGIGQHLDMINPCQYMTFMGAIANGGTAAEPYLVASARCGTDSRYTADTKMTDRVMQTSTAAKLEEMMAYNVQNVYGAWNFPSVKVCAKSGTAETGAGQTPNAMFAGFVADEEYPLAFIVVVENGGSGSAVAGPIAGTVLQACINVMGAE